MAVFFDLAGVQGASFQIGLVDGAIFNASGLTAPRTYTFPDFGGQILVGGFGMDLGDVALIPRTSGGPSAARIKAASGTNATSVKASAGQVYGWYLYNNTSSVISLHLYNTAGTPTAGSGTPLFTVPVPANGGCVVEFSTGIPFGTGIGYTITKGATSPADADTGSCTADDLHGVLLYK